MDNIASVVLSSSTRKFDKEYHYAIPEGFQEKIQSGMRVIVPFGKSNKHIEGYVTGICGEAEVEELKEIYRLLDEKPVLSSKMLTLASWMKERYICTYSDVIRCMLPPGIGVVGSKIIRLIKDDNSLKGNSLKIVSKLKESGGELLLDELKKEVRVISRYLKELEESGIIGVYEEFASKIKAKSIKAAYLKMPVEEVIEDIENNRIKNIKQIRILEMLIDNEFIGVSDIVRFAGVSPGVLKTLNKYGYIDFMDVEIRRDPFINREIPQTLPLVPTAEQENVINKTVKMIEEHRFGEILLHGITGSGKTEVYLQIIRRCIDNGRQAIVLVPEISLTPQMVERFRGRFGNDVAVLHSRLSLGERYDQWRNIHESKTKVVVGARSAIFAPLEHLGLVIIDEEHENSYKSELTPKYHANDIARERCKIENAILMYGSATPSVETYYSAKSGQIELVEMTKRANNMVLPKVHVVDMRNELEEGNRSMFSRKLREEIEKNIEKSCQTIIFLNRRGYASFVLCRSCGNTLKCPYCNVSLTYHAYEGRLICHYCGYTVKSPSNCPKCNSTHIRSFGTGTQKIEEELLKQFKGCSVLRMDMDTTTYKNSHEEILKNFKDNNINILVGTQMIAKGHDFPRVTLVGVIAADSLLNSGDYKATERTFQLITQVAGRAGRGKLSGEVVIQTYNTENFSIICACNQDYISFYEQEIMLRKKLRYPPFSHLASVMLSGVNDRATLAMAVNVGKEIKDYALQVENMEVFGPARAPISKIKGKYRWRIIIKCKELDMLLNILTKVSDGFYLHHFTKRTPAENGRESMPSGFYSKERSSVNLSVDINPVNML